MKQSAWIALVFLLTLGGALWALKVFDAPKPVDPAPESTPRPAAPTDLAAPAPSDGIPKEEPPVELPTFPEPVDVLLLGETTRSFTAWLELNWGLAPTGIRWRSWYARGVPEGATTASPGQVPFASAPLAPDLEAVEVLVVAGIDPAALPAEFWARVAERVEAGRLGLLVVPENRFAHATATEPSLAKVLPVRGSRPIVPEVKGGRDLPGVYTKPAPFRATEEGTKHAATRLVSWPIWSRRLWDDQAAASADGRWETLFCAPIAAPSTDGVVLVELDVGPVRAPAIVASDVPKRRVLWVGGFFDLRDPAYRGSKSGDRFRALAIGWIAWLAGATS